MERKKTILMWLLLIILIFLVLALNYLKFFGSSNPNIKEIPVENSTSTAIIGALTEITNQFNQNENIEIYKNMNIDIKAILNQYSIYIHYSEGESTTTYEFNYNNLGLNINVEDKEENLRKFLNVYKILIESCQRRIQNNVDFGEKINSILNEEVEWDGITIEKENGIIQYRLDITKKIELET